MIPKTLKTPSEAEKHLLEAAKHVRDNAYAPYSDYLVGAAAELADGSILAAANMENASIGLTICAEVGVLSAVTSVGLLGQVRRIAVVGGLKSGHASRVVTPCGRCRQLIAEAAELSQYDIDVICADPELKAMRRYKISELLPDAFGVATMDGAPRAEKKVASGRV